MLTQRVHLNVYDYRTQQVVRWSVSRTVYDRLLRDWAMADLAEALFGWLRFDHTPVDEELD